MAGGEGYEEYYEMEDEAIPSIQPQSQPATEPVETIETEDTQASIQMIRQMPSRTTNGSNNGKIIPASARMPQTVQQPARQTTQHAAPQQAWVQEPARPTNQPKLNQAGRPYF